MRSSVILTAAFAATAFSTPLKRDLIVETDTAIDIDYVTDIVTVTAGSEGAAATPAAPAVTTTVAAAASSYHWGHHSWHHQSSSAVVASSSEAPAAPSSSSEAAPAPSSSSEAAPAPSSYSAPAPSSSSEAPAPSSYSAPASSSSSVAATTTSAAAAATATTYQEAVVNHHNYHRANHSSPDIAWDDEMASLAAEIASTCVYAHNMSLGTYGQNIAAGIDAANISYIISDMFYNGEVNAFNGLYGQQSPDMSNFESWGHFSQIVWKGTTKVGCATQTCGSLANVGSNVPSVFTVCNYSPPGNYAGEYGTNIGDSLNQATVDWSCDVPQSGVSGS